MYYELIQCVNKKQYKHLHIQGEKHGIGTIETTDKGLIVSCFAAKKCVRKKTEGEAIRWAIDNHLRYNHKKEEQLNLAI